MRYPLLDTLRGFSLVSMVLYHYSWDLVFLSHKRIAWFSGTPGYLWQQSICWAFILISGFSLALALHGKKRTAALKKSGLLLLLGSLITAVTDAFLPQGRILFGILFFLGAATLLMPLGGNRTPLSPEAAAVLSCLLFLATRNVPFGCLGFEGLTGPVLPASLYTHGLWGTFWGFPGKDFRSADYFPLLPWFFLFATGYFSGRALLQKEKLPPVFRVSVPPLSALGRHSLILYLLHQPLLLLFVPGVSLFS